MTSSITKNQRSAGLSQTGKRERKDDKMQKVKPNTIGLTYYSCWHDMMKSLPSGKDGTLENQLDEAGVHYDTVNIDHLVGMAGTAYLAFYTSPKTGKPITTLCVPHRYDIDSWAVDYFIFEDMTKEQALKDEEWWLIAYDACNQLVG